jgi:eukaryotic-like serine/threonine-protein kinase
VQQIGSGEPLRLTKDERRDFSPVWSPDGRWIAFLRNANGLGLFAETGTNELRLVPPLGGPERKLCEIRVRSFSSSYLSWCPDSKCLVISDSPGNSQPDSLFLFWPETGEKKRLTHPSPHVQGDTNPAISPDGRSVVFRRAIAHASGALYRLALQKDLTGAGEPERLTTAPLNATFPAWFPDGRAILFSAKGFLWRLNVPGKNPPVQLPFVGEDGVMPAISRPRSGESTRLVYVRRFQDTNIRQVKTAGPGTRATGPPAVAISSTRADINARLSPVGGRVAFQSNRSGAMEIWTADIDGGNAIQVTSMGAENTSTPAWSPDGQWIAFDSNLEGQYEIYVVAASGSKPNRLTAHPANDQYPSFSQDGKWIYFTSNRTSQDQIWRMPSSGGEAVQITRNIGVVAFEGPDGSLYYSQTAGRPSPIWRLPKLGGEPIRLLDRMVHRSFVVLNAGIYYVDDLHGLQFFGFGSYKSKPVLEANGMLGGLTASPDGRIILYNSEDTSIEDLMLVEQFR